MCVCTRVCKLIFLLFCPSLRWEMMTFPVMRSESAFLLAQASGVVFYHHLRGTHGQHTGVTDINNYSWRISGGFSSARRVTPLQNFKEVFIFGWLGKDTALQQQVRSNFGENKIQFYIISKLYTCLPSHADEHLRYPILCQ